MAYAKLTDSKANIEINRLNKLFSRFLRSNGYSELTFGFSNTDLLSIINKVSQRKHYFKEFHNIDMSDLKEVSLYCFWLVKFRPYYINQEDISINDSINEKFCVYLIIHTIRAIMQSHKLDESPIEYISKEYIYELTYSFKFRDISKEALILLVETIALMCGVKPYKELTPDAISESEIE